MNTCSNLELIRIWLPKLHYL